MAVLKNSETTAMTFSDGTGREPAVAEMSRPVNARAAISIDMSPTSTHSLKARSNRPSPLCLPLCEMEHSIQHANRLTVVMPSHGGNLPRLAPAANGGLFCQVLTGGFRAPKVRL
jgi:hypothetical protein